MVFQPRFAEHQLIRAIDAIHGAELGINNGSLDLLMAAAGGVAESCTSSCSA